MTKDSHLIKVINLLSTGNLYHSLGLLYIRVIKINIKSQNWYHTHIIYFSQSVFSGQLVSATGICCKSAGREILLDLRLNVIENVMGSFILLPWRSICSYTTPIAGGYNSFSTADSYY